MRQRKAGYCREYLPVRILIKTVSRQRIKHIRHRIGFDEHGSQHSLLDIQGLRRLLTGLQTDSIQGDFFLTFRFGSFNRHGLQ